MLKEDGQLEPEIAGRILRKFIDKNKVDGIVGLNF
jgi:branched-chain amino acid transport system substrate-binding protein